MTQSARAEAATPPQSAATDAAPARLDATTHVELLADRGRQRGEHVAQAGSAQPRVEDQRGAHHVGTRVVEVIWPKVANSDNHSWDHHVGLTERMKDKSGPMLDQGLSALLTDLDERGMLDETLVVAVGEFGRSPQKGVSTSGNGNSADGRDHWPYCYTAVVAGAGIKRGHVHGKSDKTGSAPAQDPVHPGELLATIYHAFGIDPATIVYNHLNQPRELVKAEAVARLFA